MKLQWVVIGLAVALGAALAYVLLAPRVLDETAQLLAEGATAASQLDRALVDLERAVSDGGEDPSGIQQRIDESYDRAASAYEAAYVSDPSADVLVILGHLHLSVGEIDSARRAFVKALTQWPGTPAAYGGLGDVLFAFADYRGAIENYQNALWWDQNGGPSPGIDERATHTRLGDAALLLHLPVLAQEHYRAVLVTEPESFEALLGLADALLQQFDDVEALAVLEDAARVGGAQRAGEIRERIALIEDRAGGAALPEWTTEFSDTQPDAS